MFTGIIEATGSVVTADMGPTGGRLLIESRRVAPELGVGDSISVDGVCLTVTNVDSSGFAVDVISETISRTNLATLRPGSRVNLELPLRVDGRFGGHIVQGHIDAVGVVTRVEPDGAEALMQIKLPIDTVPYVVEKGSIAVNGVSLTVAAVAEETFEVALIPHTLESTSLGALAVGDEVNVEVDVIAKYVAQLTKERE